MPDFTIPFDDFGLIILGDAEIPFTGEFDLCEKSGAIEAIRIEAWRQQARGWRLTDLPREHWLYALMRPQLEGAYEREIAEALAEHWSAESLEEIIADQKYDLVTHDV